MKYSGNFISVIIPAYNEEGNILILTERLHKVLDQFSEFEIIFIDDGSNDNTLNNIKIVTENFKNIKYISFTRNFGHQNALRAGINYAKGNCIISMDADLQHPPELLPLFIEKWNQGYDIVYSVRSDNNKTSWIKKLTSNTFYRILNFISDIKIEQGAADFRLIDRKVADCLNTMPESDIFYRGMLNWLGFKSIGIRYCAEKRKFGRSKYSYGKMFSLATRGITSLSIKPLKISTYLGLIIASLSIIFAFYAVFIKLFTDRAIQGWSSILIMICFIGGIQLIMIGILGEYIGRIFLETKKRPDYIIKESNLNY